VRRRERLVDRLLEAAPEEHLSLARIVATRAARGGR
jgi:hypothetical protein